MEMKHTLSKVCDVKKEDLFKRPSLSLYVESPNNVEGGKRRKGFGAMFGTGMKQRSGGTHTLLSVNPAAKSKKNNEYFGGDSTVTLAGEEDEEEPARDDEEREEADDESN